MKSIGQKIADAALEWLGTPYVNNAMAKGHSKSPTKFTENLKSATFCCINMAGA